MHRAGKQASSDQKKKSSCVSGLILGRSFILPCLWWWCSSPVERHLVLGTSSLGLARLCPWYVLGAEAELSSKGCVSGHHSHLTHHAPSGIALLMDNDMPTKIAPIKTSPRWKQHRRDQQWEEMWESVILRAGETWSNPTFWKSKHSISFYLYFFHL